MNKIKINHKKFASLVSKETQIGRSDEHSLRPFVAVPVESQYLPRQHKLIKITKQLVQKWEFSPSSFVGCRFGLSQLKYSLESAMDRSAELATLTEAREYDLFFLDRQRSERTIAHPDKAAQAKAWYAAQLSEHDVLIERATRASAAAWDQLAARVAEAESAQINVA